MVFQPGDALRIEMVSGLIEQQYAGLFEQQPAERHAALLTTRQVFHRTVPRRATQRLHRNFQLVIERPAIHRVDFLLQNAHFFHQRVEIGVFRRVAHQLGNFIEPADIHSHLTNAVHNVLFHGPGRIQVRLLLEIADRDPLTCPGFAGEILVLPGHDFHQRRFTDTIGADNADLGIGIELQIDILENRFLLVLVGLSQTLHDKTILGGHLAEFLVLNVLKFALRLAKAQQSRKRALAKLCRRVRQQPMRKITTAITSAAAFLLATQAWANNHDPMKLQAKALKDTLAYEITEGLTTEVGPRQGGTEAEARARDWSLKKLKSLGFSNVRNEPFMMDTWVRGAETAEITTPFPQKMHVTALGGSASTGDVGIEAEIAYFPSLAALRAAPEGSLTGKIAFVTHNMKPSQDGSGYGTFGPIRWIGGGIAAQKGAAAYVIKSIGTDYHRNPHTGGAGFPGVDNPIPAGALSLPDADNLERMVKLADKSGQKVKMKLVLTPRLLGKTESGNVIAEVPGRDLSKPMILIACHLDSWDLAPGAFDDASGCGIITAAAKNIMDHGKPLRTIRILWAGAEEVGLWGGRAYAKDHVNTKHAIAMESDFGADRVWRVEFKLPEGAKDVRAEISQALLPLGIGSLGPPASGGADIRDVIAAQNLAIIDLQQDGTRYFDLHHTPDDTLDKIDPEQLRQNVAAWTTVLSIIANSDADFTLPAKD